ncbi:hypothetical protein C8R44DRAFT_670175 [Mycena epipterygia]|nr:hypothetical protein C8R44DRAFT_670175 [Mycena epipterygia]
MSTLFRVRKLEAPTSGSLPEFDEIESVLSRSFVNDPLAATVTAHDLKEPDRSYVGPFVMSTVVAGLLDGEIYVAETNDTHKKIVGCAVWFAPGHTMWATEESQKQSLHPLMAPFDDKLKNWWLTQFVPQYDTFVTAALGAGTKHNSWHLQTLGVDPDYQRKGAAGLLINMMVERARPTGTLLCLETDTETNIEVYTKLGFEIMPKGKGGRDDCKEIITGVIGNTSPMWVMVRAFN